MLLLRRRKHVRLTLLLLLFALLGAWRYQSHPLKPSFAPSDLAYHNGGDSEPAWATIEGVVVDYPHMRDQYATYELSVQSLQIDEEPRSVSSRLRLQAPRYPEFRYGDRLRVTALCAMEVAHGEFPPTRMDYHAICAPLHLMTNCGV